MTRWPHNVDMVPLVLILLKVDSTWRAFRCIEWIGKSLRAGCLGVRVRLSFLGVICLGNQKIFQPT